MTATCWTARVSTLALAVLGCLLAPASAAAPEAGRKLLQTNGVLNLATTTLHGDTTGFVVYGKDAHDRLGNTVDIGDLNGDGWGDMVISAFFADGANNTATKAGEVYVLFGSAAGWPDSIDLSTLVLDGTNGFVVHGKDANDRLGLAVAVGDVNGDGFNDLALGAHLGDGTESNVVKGSGEVWVLLGRASGFLAEVDLATAVLDGVNGFVVHGMDRWDRLGFSVNIADVNGDGTGDMILGAVGGDGVDGTPTNRNAGEVHVIFGRTSGFGATVHLETFVFTGRNGLSIYGADRHDFLGFSVTVGDLNGDFKADIILSAVRADGASDNQADTGEVYVLFGSGSWPAVIDLNVYELNGFNGLTIYGKDSWDRMGRALAVGDINGDGQTDLLISSHRGDGAANNENKAGEAYVLFGKAGWPPVIDLKTKTFTGADGFQIIGRDGGDTTGFAVDIGDINGDGFGDIVISAKGADGEEDVSNGWNKGEVDVIYGRSDFTGWPAKFDLAQETLDGTNGFVVYGKDNHDLLGRSAAVGDLNGDHFPDLILGAFKGDGSATNLAHNSGEAYVIYGVPLPPKCPAGQYDWNHVRGGALTCVDCQPGHYCTGIGAQTKCPVHYTSAGASSSYSDCVCVPGYFRSGSACVKCEGCDSNQEVGAHCTITQPTQCNPCSGWRNFLDQTASNFGIVRSCGGGL